LLTDKKNMPDMLAYHDGFADFKHIESELVYSGGMVETPKVSIMIPTYKRPELLKEAIESALNQKTNIRYEVVVVDNNNDQEQASAVNDLVKSFNAKNLDLYRNKQNIGMFGNWNRCFELSRAEWVSILNDDDLLGPDFLNVIFDIQNKKTKSDLIQTGFACFNSAKSDIRPEFDEWKIIGEKFSAVLAVSYKKLSLANTRVGSLGIVYKRDTAIRIGGFNPDEYPTADYCFNIRYLAAGNIGYEVQAVHSLYRISQNESQKPEVLAGFVSNDFVMRNKIAPGFSFPWLMMLYARITVAIQVYFLEKVWGVSIPKKMLEQRLGYNPCRSALCVFISRLISAMLRRVLYWVS
jgi:glycosyltransferase involved in cell wall biosynthesis